ncbi:MAG TPA: hypothetical protein VN033_14910 [Vulgatibacter sp.]|nr:hypothetical protein [Vulgatibacter sp.]
MRLAIFTAIAAIALAIPLESEAGGVVIHYRDVARAAASRGVEAVALPGANAGASTDGGSNVGVVAQSASTGAGTSSGQTSGVPGGGKPPAGVPLPSPGGPNLGEEATTGATSTPAGDVTRFGADDGSLEHEVGGCGGATSARGPVGLLPFAVAAFALLRRGRRA